MTLQQISLHERAGMLMRQIYGYAQHDQHVWCWLVEMIRLWGEANPIKVSRR